MSRFLLVLAVFLVSTAGLFAHRALAEATPLAVASWRLGLAALFFLGVSRFRPRSASSPPPPLSSSAWARLSVGGICLALHFVTWFAAMDRTSIAQATLLSCTTPLWTTLGAFSLGRRRPALRDLAALLIAGLGLWFVIQTSSQSPTPATLLGNALGLTSGLMLAVYLLCAERLHPAVSSQRQVTVAYSVAAALLWAVLLAQGGAKFSYSPAVWGAMLGMTLGPQIIGHTLINASLRHFSSSVVAFAVLLEPVIVAVLAWLLLGQRLAPAQIGGGCLVLAALVLAITGQMPKAQMETEPVG